MYGKWQLFGEIEHFKVKDLYEKYYKKKQLKKIRK